MKLSIKIMYWTPRVICILSILFISLFAFDSFESNTNIWQNITDLLMHLIPTFILTAMLFIAWKWEFIGGIIFTVIGIGMSPFIFMLNYNRNHFSISQCLGIIAMINLPFIVVGILFIVSHYMKKRDTISS